MTLNEQYRNLDKNIDEMLADKSVKIYKCVGFDMVVGTFDQIMELRLKEALEIKIIKIK